MDREGLKARYQEVDACSRLRTQQISRMRPPQRPRIYCGAVRFSSSLFGHLQPIMLFSHCCVQESFSTLPYCPLQQLVPGRSHPRRPPGSSTSEADLVLRVFGYAFRLIALVGDAGSADPGESQS